MQKFLFAPFTAMILAGCSSNPPAPVVDAHGSLNSRAIQSVPEAGYGWQTDIQNTPMPSTMTAPTYPVPQPVYQAQPQPIPQPIPQPVYQAPPQPITQSVSAPQPVPTPISTPKPVAAPKPAPKSQPVATVSQDFTIPRDEKNVPIYSQIDKGFYNGDTYKVRKGDTIFLVAYIAGKDVKEVAALNNIQEPYPLRIGQVLKLGNTSTQTANSVTPTVQQKVQQAPKPEPAPVEPVKPQVTYTQAPNGTAYGSDGTVTGPIKAGAAASTPNPTPRITATTPRITATTATVSASTASINKNTNTATPPSSIKWKWPTEGRIIAGFSSIEGGNKGIDIAGTKGQAVKAAAAGKVVYAGNALQGYGNLIIIKHNDNFLSAYAHNDQIKVDEQDNVKAGETIATLGSTGTNTNKLHFEIRYLGKSVDPTRYLPKR
ncbi:murein hydrolase activator NlpD [Otariodibacter sp.]|uniref:murein hydrolase activator NlpD n=1 Tax=Otariodibacter sp. TaxID=3030919 RepID=UPI00262CAC91|nr:murein hydrolase activator NlpD [Otariodibacter sp.]